MRRISIQNLRVLGLTDAQYSQILGNLHESLIAREPIRFGEGRDEFTYRWQDGERWVIHLGRKEPQAGEAEA